MKALQTAIGFRHFGSLLFVTSKDLSDQSFRPFAFISIGLLFHQTPHKVERLNERNVKEILLQPDPSPLAGITRGRVLQPHTPPLYS